MERRALDKPSNRALSLLKLEELLANGSIYLNAPYQRGVVWSSEQMSDLIESISKGIYIPAVVFAIQETENGKLRVCIDGKQRLTTIYRFMRNEIPFIDRSGGTIVKRYYSKAIDERNSNISAILSETPRQYLTPSQLTQINRFEIMCVDYKNLTEDEEYEMFFRVQQGVVLSSDEKLRAHNTPIAKVVRSLSEIYPNVGSLLANPSPASTFRFIAELLCNLRNGPHQFVHLPADIERFILEKYEYPTQKLDQAKRALSVVSSMMQDENCKNVFIRHPNTNKKYLIRKIELLVFTYYLCLSNTIQRMSNLAEDCLEMRKQMRQTPTGRIELGRRCWKIGMEWCDAKLTEQNLLQQRKEQQQLLLLQQQQQQQRQQQQQQQQQRQKRQRRSNNLNGCDLIEEDSEVDELKSEDEDSDISEQPAAAFRGSGINMIQNMSRGARKPTARRGGRAPRPE